MEGTKAESTTKLIKRLKGEFYRENSHSSLADEDHRVNDDGDDEDARNDILISGEFGRNWYDTSVFSCGLWDHSACTGFKISQGVMHVTCVRSIETLLSRS